jgi:uncharacterized protein
MKSLESRIESVNWTEISERLHSSGYAVVHGVLSESECDEIRATYNLSDKFRKTVVMERYRFGRGEYKYFHYPLPEPIDAVRTKIYSHLAPVANGWMTSLNTGIAYPANHGEFLETCHQQQQDKATVLILKYGKGGHNTLHQDLYGAVYFPLQIVFMLSQPGEDFSGGEFVLVEQTPRAQSKAIVLDPQKGDMIIFASNFRPVQGKRGFYRTNMKHGVSEVTNGDRYTLGVIFHDALA